MKISVEQGPIVGTIRKNGKTRVRVSHQTINGLVYVDIRQFRYIEDEDYWRRTSKGVTLAPETVAKLRDALTAALDGQTFTDPALVDVDPEGEETQEKI